MAIILGGGGGGFRWPWEKSIEQHIEEFVSTPAIIPIAAPLAIAKIGVTKGIAAILGAGAGLVIGSTLFGGKSQEVKPVQTTTVTPALTAQQKLLQLLQQRMRDLNAKQEAAAEAKAVVTPTVTPVVSPVTTTTYDVEAGGDVEIGGVSTTTHTPTTTTTTTITHAGVSQEVVGQLSLALQQATQEPQQITIVTPTQETTATQMDLGWVAIAAAAIIAAGMIFKKGK